MPLTDSKIKHAKHRDKVYKLSDGGGLYIQIQALKGEHRKTSKHWRLAYRYARRQRTLALGEYPLITLVEAREKREQAKKLLEQGIDPALRLGKKARLEQETSKSENTFEAIARKWYNQERGAWSEGHATRVINSLEREAFPDLGPLPIHEITTANVLAIIRKIEARDTLEVSSRVLQRCRSVFAYAIDEEKIENNPAVGIGPKQLKKRKVQHRPALNRADLPEFLAKLEKYDGHLITKLALKLVLLTFVRISELRGALWNEFDTDNAIWRIPAERMKMGAAHIVPLSRQSLAVLGELRQLTGTRDLIFPGERTWKKPISENTMLYALYRMGYHKRATVHGFRATASTTLNENGFNSDAIERQLAHEERNKIRAAYNRAEYLEERKEIMQWWGDFLDGLATSSNVVSINSTNERGETWTI